MVEQLTAPVELDKEYSTATFAARINVSIRTLEKNRSKRKQRFMPARYDDKGKAIYLESQVEAAMALFHPAKKSTVFDDNFVPLFADVEEAPPTDDAQNAEARLGELFKQMPKVGVGGNGSNQHQKAIIPATRNNCTTANNPNGNNQFRSNSPREEIDQNESEDESEEIIKEPPPKPKLEVAADMGFNKNQVAQFQKLADNPDAVQEAQKNSRIEQQTENYPAEIRALRSFIPAKGKKPVIKQWNVSKNWRTLEQINLNVYTAAFMMRTPADVADEDYRAYLVVDFDHVLSEPYNLNSFVTPEAKAWYDFINSVATYSEYSNSGRGFHFVLCPSHDSHFPIINAAINLAPSQDTKDSKVKAEFFYRANHPMTLTGKIMNQTTAQIIHGKEADKILIALATEYNVQRQELYRRAVENAPAYPAEDSPLTAPADELQRILSCIPVDALDRKDWWLVGAVLESISHDNFELWNEWSAKDTRPGEYDEKECRYQWDKMPEYRANCPKPARLGTLIYIAKRFGYQPPKVKPKLNHNRADDDDQLAANLRDVNKAIDDFNAQKNSALEALKNLQAFDRKTILSADVKTAAAYACAFDKSAFADLKGEIQRYGKIHADVKLNLPDLNAAIKELVTELKAQLADLMTRRNEIQAQIKSRSFAADNDLLNGLTIPVGYSLTKEFGIEKVEGEGMITICRRPVIISSKSFDVEEKIYKLVLAYLAQGGSWQLLPPTNAAIVYDAKRLVGLADNGLPVTSSNAKGLVEYFDAFNAENENNFPLTYTVPRCGWYRFNDKDYFIDPRRNCVIKNEGKNISVVVDEKSNFAQHLRTVGELEKWKCAYNLAKQSPVARLVTAAAIAPILLKILGVRNFVLYLYGRTRGGKTTALMLAASTIGDEKILRSFDSTKNALLGAAADVNDYAFLVDEKQSADTRLKENLAEMVYGIGNGIGRSRLNRNGTVQPQKDWRTIAIMTGETQLLADNTVEGADTRCIQIHAPNVILPPDGCRQIRSIIKDNFGIVKPLVIDEVLTTEREDLREIFNEIVKGFEQKYPDVLDDYRRYIALLAIADAVLNKVQGVDEEAAMEDAVKVFSANIMPLIPTTFDINATDLERDFVLDFIANNQNHFIGGNADLERIQTIFGRLRCDDGYTYILAFALKEACQKAGIDYQKLVSDLVADGFFKPDDKIPPKRKKPNDTVIIWLEKAPARCLRIPRDRFDKTPFESSLA